MTDGATLGAELGANDELGRSDGWELGETVEDGSVEGWLLGRVDGVSDGSPEVDGRPLG